MSKIPDVTALPEGGTAAILAVRATPPVSGEFQGRDWVTGAQATTPNSSGAEVQVFRSGSDAQFTSGSGGVPIGFACCMEPAAP